VVQCYPIVRGTYLDIYTFREPETVDQGSPPVAVNGKDLCVLGSLGVILIRISPTLSSESNMKERKSYVPLNLHMVPLGYCLWRTRGQTSPTKRGLEKSNKPELYVSRPRTFAECILFLFLFAILLFIKPVPYLEVPRMTMTMVYP
jgi:hypothetical protein